MSLRVRSPLRWALAAATGAAAGYAGIAAIAFWRYGAAVPAHDEAADPLLDQFMPVFDVVERHHIRVAAPAAVTMAAAADIDLEQSPLTRAIFRARELALGASPAQRTRPRGVLALLRSLGWTVLVEVPDREIVVGAVTKPWQADVVFRPIPAEAFRAFDEPDYVKIVWTLRADPIDARSSVFRTETRAVATSREAKRKFRRYWAFASPGIGLIRWLLLSPLRSEAERRARS